MRTRKSNRQKRFRESDFGIGLDSGDEDLQDAGEVDDSADPGFMANDQDQDDIEMEDAVEADSDSDVVMASVDDEERPKPQKKRRAPVAQPEKALHEVQPYPMDASARWTRQYLGPLKRWTRFKDLAGLWFGHLENFGQTLQAFHAIWEDDAILPPKLASHSSLSWARNPWLPADYWSAQEAKFQDWFRRYQTSDGEKQKAKKITESMAKTWFVPQNEDELHTLLGPYDSQKEYKFTQNDCITISESGSPIDMEGDDAQSSGWMFDAGGLVLSLNWAPTDSHADQILALSVIPFSDQAFFQRERDVPPESKSMHGNIQIWKFTSKRDSNEVARTTSEPPRMTSILCCEWGRVLRMQWCPVRLTIDSHIGLLAILCGDGKVRVLEVKRSSKGKVPVCEELETPMVVLGNIDEYRLESTCFTWVNTNRIAIGHSDGTISLWSIYPRRLLQRHPVHPSYVIDISSAYPSHPFIVTSTPAAGCSTVLDLSRPSSEMTYFPLLGVSLQGSLLQWSDHLQGWLSIYPASHNNNMVLAFFPIATFAQPRTVLVLSAAPTCCSIGTTHPYVIAGGADGALWATSALKKLVTYKKMTQKIKLLQHDFRPTDTQNSRHNEQEAGDTAEEEPRSRGVARILHGFLPENNMHPRAERQKVVQDKKKDKGKDSKKSKAKSGKQKGAASKTTDGEDIAEVFDGDEDGQDDGEIRAQQQLLVYEPLLRITAVSWNPNVEYGWWAAVAMGSGLVRVMDLGIGEGV